MNFLLLLVLFGTFFSCFGMQETISIRYATQDLFDHAVYPSTLEQMLTFEKAKRMVHTDSDEAQQRFIMLAQDKNNPLVPAMRELVRLAAQNEDNKTMYYWAVSGVNRCYPDPTCAAALAQLLLHDKDDSLLPDVDPIVRERTIYNLLKYAVEPDTVTATGRPGRIYFYQYKPGLKLLENFLMNGISRLHAICEKKLYNLSVDDRDRLQFDTIKEKRMPNACFFIKDLAHNYKEWRDTNNEFCITPHAEHALQWATFVAGGHFGSHYLRETGAYAALCTVRMHTEDDELRDKLDTFLVRIEHNDSDITREEQQKAEEYLLQVSAQKDLRSLLELAKRNDSKLFYTSQLVNLLPTASNQDYPQLLEEVLQLLRSISRSKDAANLISQILKSERFLSYKEQFALSPVY
jgi:hypothetical protein